MPVIDPAVVNQANQVLTNGGYAQKLAFLRQYPVCPPSNYQGGTHQLTVTAKSPFGAAGDTRAKKFLSKKKLASAEDRVAFIKFEAMHSPSPEEGSLTFKVKYASDLPQDNDRIGYTPIWFLPWESGFMWKIPIDSNAISPTLQVGVGSTAIPNPDLFFTAAINGCSVFARGNQDSPRVYHGGAEQNEIAEIKSQLGNAFWNAMGGNAEGMWLNLFKGLQPDAHNPASLAPIGGQHKQGFFGEINKNQYVKQTAMGAPVISPLSQRPGLPAWAQNQPSTQLALTVENYLTTSFTYMNIRVEEVSPWGCVFGMRNGNNWEFYLQTNATVKYFSLRTKKRFFKKNKVVAEGQLDGQGQPTQWAKAQSIHFGTQQFFPGANGHAMVPLNSFRFF
jgi:hypothetical protein